ncbi:YdcF family protein [Hymenobacter sedentarius]|uniref:YdcF family protein n=1 Tax=Hymenobacter sedentarius TaxID=1411621 RepID=UPI0018EE4C2B|nr:YdcF family protein [Hymenobacter sedentarius]
MRPRLTGPDSIIVAKTYPLLALFEAQHTLPQALQTDAVLQAVARRQAQRSYQVLKRRPVNVRRYVDSLVWQPREIRAIGQALNRLYLADPALHAAVLPLLGTAGRYPRYAALPDTAVLRLAWQDAAQGLNRIARVYLAGMVPRYPVVDSISFERHDAALAQAVRKALLARTKSSRRRPAAFYTLSLQAARMALRLNGRDEAARYEPLGAGLNAAPRAAVAHTDWARFPYSLILVPGLGPEQAGVSLDSLGAFRCRLAAVRYRAGQAPFLVVSGGHVHPNKTPYCEAVEMKKYMVEKLGLPDAAVLIEPHARHTTTNLRNTARIVYAFGFPADKPMLIVTDASQSRSIVDMAERCRKELGYVPYRDLKRLSELETSCFPVPEARQPDPFDPLDP